MSLTKYETSHSKGSVPIPVLAQEQAAPVQEELTPVSALQLPQPSPYIIEPLVIQVTFLNKVNRVTMDPRVCPHAVHVMRMVAPYIKLVEYFSIKLELIKSTHLIDLEEYNVVELDAPLVNGRAYYLGFTRYGKPSLVSNHMIGQGVDAATAWNGRRLFSREGRQYQIKAQKCFDAGIVTELKICRNTPNRLGFTCPFSHCGRLFHKSCDLITGNRPFFCQICGRSFRRKVLLNHHAREGPCRRRSSNPLVTSNPFSISKYQSQLASSDDHGYKIQSSVSGGSSNYKVHSTAPESPIFSGVTTLPGLLTSKVQAYLQRGEKVDASISFLNQLKLLVALAKKNPILLTLIRFVQINRNKKMISQISITANPREICHELMVTSLLLNL